MKKVFLIFGTLLIFASCSEESPEMAELSAEYGIPVEVLKSQEFKDYISIMEISLRERAKAQDEFYVATSKNPEKLNALKDIDTEIQSKNHTAESVNQLYKSKIGASPINVYGKVEVDQKRETFFRKFPEYRGNVEKLSTLEDYFKKEVLDYDFFMADREKKVFEQLEN